MIEPGKRPRVTLTPTLALKDGAPYLAFAVQGGDTQDQNLLQFFLNVVEFGMTVQQAVEAPNINSYQMRTLVRRARVAAGPHAGGDVAAGGPREALRRMGYTLEFEERTSGPINAIWFDREARHDVGRVEQSRRGLRDRVVSRSASGRRSNGGKAAFARREGQRRRLYRVQGRGYQVRGMAGTDSTEQYRVPRTIYRVPCTDPRRVLPRL